jgi:uncharacterized protein YoxC
VSSSILTDIDQSAYAYVGQAYTTIVSSYTTSDLITIESDSNGFFEFWVSDKGAENTNTKGYDYTQLFTLAIVKSGFTTTCIENINIFPINYSVTETDTTSTFKNKSVSNRIITLLDQHRTATYSSYPHDIYPASETSLQTEVDWLTKNKLISNKHFIDLVNNTSTIDSYDSKIIFLSGHINENISNLTEQTNRITALSGEVNTINDDILDITNNIDNIESDINWLSGQLSEISLEEIENATEGIQDLNSDILFLSGKISQNTFDIVESIYSTEEFTELVLSIQSNVSINYNNIVNLTSKTNIITGDIVGIDDDIIDMEASISALETRVDQLSADVIYNTSVINWLSGEIADVDFSSIYEDINWLSGQFSNIDFSSIETLIDNNTQDINWLSGNLDDVELALTNLIQDNTQDINWLSGEIDDIRLISGISFGAQLSADIEELRSDVN